MMIGLPRSGKSTQAKRLSDKYGWPIVNTDSVRLATHGQRWWTEGEPLVWAITKIMVSALFKAGHKTIILDNTNLNDEFRLEWVKYCDEIKHVYVNTSIDECKKRAILTGQDDLIEVIDRMANILELPNEYLEIKPR